MVHPDWSVITENQALKTFRDNFILFWKHKFGQDIDVAISFEQSVPTSPWCITGVSFTLLRSRGRDINLAETITSDYKTTSERSKSSLKPHEDRRAAFPDGWVIDLVADGMNLTDSTQKYAFEAFETNGLVIRRTWIDFLASATTAHEEFLDAYDRAHSDEPGDSSS